MEKDKVLRQTELVGWGLKIKMPTGVRRKERCDHLFEPFQEDADGWKQKKQTMIDDDEGEGQGFATNRAGWMKARLDQMSEDELRIGNEDVPVSVTTMVPTKEMKSAKDPRPWQNERQQTAPAQLTSGVSINNYSSGTVKSSDVGNIKGTTFSNMGNNNSENYFHWQPTGRQKPTYAKEKKSAITPRQKRRVTTPALSISGVAVHNHGSGTVDNSEVGNITNSTISNVGNDNSKNYFRKPTYDDYGQKYGKGLG